MNKRAREIKAILVPVVESAIERGFLVNPTGVYARTNTPDGTVCLKGALVLRDIRGTLADLMDLQVMDDGLWNQLSAVGVSWPEINQVEAGFERPGRQPFGLDPLVDLGRWFRAHYCDTWNAPKRTMRWAKGFGTHSQQRRGIRK